MELYDHFSDKLKLILEQAFTEARAMNMNYVGTEHILLALLKVKSEIINQVKRYNQLTYKDIKKECLRFVGIGLVEREIQGYSKRASEILKLANFEATSLKSIKVEPEHLMLSLMDISESTAVKVLEKCGFSAFDLKTDIIRELDAKDKAKQKKKKEKIEGSFIEKFGINMTRLAKLKKYDPLVGREDSVKRVVQILGRRTKNNPCLIGEPGVGKTAIAEGVARLMIKKDAPDYLVGKQLVSISLATMLAGSKFRGEFEDRLTQLIQEVRGKKDIILFIDEIHTLVGAGATQGAMDAANILKPFLSRDDIQLIGATTISEYRKYIEKDQALERRLQPVMVQEPSVQSCVEMLKGLKKNYEDYHNLIITDDSIEAAVHLSSEYVTDRFLPDKAIDLMDEAASRTRLLKLDVLTPDKISEVIELWTGIPMSYHRKQKHLVDLEPTLKSVVIGQDLAVSSVVKTLKRSTVGLGKVDKPLGSFIFLGTTGVGKTELAKALSSNLFGSGSLIRLDMSEYMEKQSVSKLIGSPPGYVAYEEGGQLTEKVRTNPFSVILLDELEKAHPDVINLFLQLLDEGILTDSKGRTISFKQCIIVFTSNVGTEKISKQSIGFSQVASDDYLVFEERLMEELKKSFRAEFLNRIDDIVIFNALSEKDVYKIIDKLINELIQRVKTLGFTLSITSGVKKRIFDVGYTEQYGVRSLKRSITRLIEDPLSDYLLRTDLNKGCLRVKLNGKSHIQIQEKC